MNRSRVAYIVGLMILLGASTGACEDERASFASNPSTQPDSAVKNPLARDAAGSGGNPVNPLDKSAGGNPLAQTGTANAMNDGSKAFHGVFHTTVQGNTGVLRLEQSGTRVSGKLDQALLSGTVDGNTARGDLKNPENGEVGGTYFMTRKGDQIEFQLTLKDPSTGQTVTLPAFAFMPGEPPEPSANLDQQLVGRWRNTETYVSGDFSAATDTWLILNADGTFEYGHGKTGAGGAAGSVVSGRGDATTGKWRSQDKMLMYQETGSSGWETFARYYVEGDTMMLTYGNGNKKIWNRQ